MGILEKISFINKTANRSDTLSNWNSREISSTFELNTTDVSIVQEFIETHDSYEVYKNCFINYIFLSQIASCFHKRKLFVNCEFEVTNLLNCSSFLIDFEFKNCTFYIADYEKNTISFNIKTTLESIFFLNNNTLHKKSYIEYLMEKYNFNLNKVPKHLLSGILLNYSDLSKCTLPKDPDFFKNLADSEVHDLKLPKIDLNKYDLSRTRFTNVIFTADSILSESAMKTGLHGSVLPKIDFNQIKTDKNITLKFFHCKFNEDTIFPDDEEFFTRCMIRNCTMPTFNYSRYTIPSDAFYECCFADGSKLPEELFTSKYIKTVEKIKRIPKEYLERAVILCELKKPVEFYKKYEQSLSNNEKYLLCRKYNII